MRDHVGETFELFVRAAQFRFGLLPRRDVDHRRQHEESVFDLDRGEADLDGDLANDLSGTIFLTDAGGAITLPASLVTLLGGGGSLDLDTILALLPDGTNVNLTFDFDDLALVSGASGDGDLSAEVTGGAVTSVSGGGTFASGECAFDFDFSGLGPEILEGGGFGSGSVAFDLGVGTESVGGSIVLDGTPARLAGHQDIREFYLGGGERRRSYREVKQYRRSRRWYG